MNKKQKTTLVFFICFVVATVIYPPFYIKMQGLIVRSEYSWIWKPIMYGTQYGRTTLGTVDISRVFYSLLVLP